MSITSQVNQAKDDLDHAQGEVNRLTDVMAPLLADMERLHLLDHNGVAMVATSLAIIVHKVHQARSKL